MNRRAIARAERAQTACGCGRPASHRGMCPIRVAKKRAEGWMMAPKRRPKAPGLVEDCMVAIEALHDACVQFAFAYRRLRPVQLERALGRESVL